MMITYREVNLRPRSIALIDECNDIIGSYRRQGLRLTLRQLYYQLVTRNLITNEEKSYRNLGAIVSDGRLAGLIDWEAIEDRVRQPRTVAEFENLAELAGAALNAYRLPRWRGQNTYAELWVEKDALAGVLEPLAREFHVTLMVNRGYSSQSAMFESAQRFIDRCAVDGDEDDNGSIAYRDGNAATGGEEITLAREPVLFYLGDHDPSGEDMVRDIRDRLFMFGIEVDVRKIALTYDHVQEYNPPPNPAKITDSRAPGYIAKYGRSSWEVDALPPNVLAEIVRDNFASVVDVEKMDAVKSQEEIDKAELRKAVEKIMKNGKGA